MNTIVNRLLEVDREARRMLDEAQQYRERTMQDTEREKQRVLNELSEKADRHIRELDEEQAVELQEAVTAVSTRTRSVRAALKAHYDANHTRWEDELFQMVVQGAHTE